MAEATGAPPAADAERWQLVVEHEPHLARLAKKLARSTARESVDPEELAAAARPVLFKAAAAYRPGRGDFWSYAAVFARGAMLAWMREFDDDRRSVPFSRTAGAGDAAATIDAYTADRRADDPAQRSAAVETVLAGLPPNLRAAVYLSAVRGESPAAVARQLRMTTSAAIAAVDAGLGRLRVRFRMREREPVEPQWSELRPTLDRVPRRGRRYWCPERPGRTFTLAEAARESGATERTVETAIRKRRVTTNTARCGGLTWHQVGEPAAVVAGKGAAHA